MDKAELSSLSAQTKLIPGGCKVKRAAYCLLGLGLYAGMQSPLLAEEQKVDDPDKKLYPGAIYVTNQGMITDLAVPLGAPVNQSEIDGVDVRLFVLRAESPARHQPGARGPTHLFNITFSEDNDEGLIKEALGALIIEGHGKPQRVALRPHESHHRAFARFDMEGDYQISVEYVVKGRKNRTEPISINIPAASGRGIKMNCPKS